MMVMSETHALLLYCSESSALGTTHSAILGEGILLHDTAGKAIFAPR